MRLSSIDIGTNTVLLLVADIDERGVITPVAYEQRIPRLGKDVDAERRIGQPAFARVAEVLREYQEISRRLGVDRIVAVGTSAVREATNRAEFLDFIKKQTGISIEVISGEEEARLTYFGAASGLDSTLKRIAVIDVGGGSTEITVGGRTMVDRNVSLDVGSVRITERYFKHDPPQHAEVSAATKFIHDALRSVNPSQFSGTTLVGVAGTATTLAALDQGLKDFDRAKVTGYKLSVERVERLFDQLHKLNASQIRALSNVTEGRADILTAGALILLEFMKTVAAEELVVSERGVRYGVVLREWKKEKTSKS